MCHSYPVWFSDSCLHANLPMLRPLLPRLHLRLQRHHRPYPTMLHHHLPIIGQPALRPTTVSDLVHSQTALPRLLHLVLGLIRTHSSSHHPHLHHHHQDRARCHRWRHSKNHYLHGSNYPAQTCGFLSPVRGSNLRYVCYVWVECWGSLVACVILKCSIAAPKYCTPYSAGP